MSKKIWFIGSIVILLLVAARIGNMVLVGGVDAPMLKLKTAFSADKIIYNVSCGTDYNSWRILQTDVFLPGNEFELGEAAGIGQSKILQLISSGKIIASIQDTNYLHTIPTGDAFTEAYLFVSPTTLFYDPITTGIQITVPASKMSEQDFNAAAECLSKNQKEIAVAFGVKPIDATQLVGSFLRIDDTVGRDPYYFGPEFSCDDGEKATTNGVRLNFLPAGGTWEKDTKYIGMIGFDGKVYKGDELYVDTSHDITLPNTICKNSEGMTLQDYLSSIPKRITFLSN